jgi:hypothetical protein
MKGDATSQRRWEAYDKLGTFVIFVMSIVLGIQAMGLEGERRKEAGDAYNKGKWGMKCGMLGMVLGRFTRMVKLT